MLVHLRSISGTFSFFVVYNMLMIHLRDDDDDDINSVFDSGSLQVTLDFHFLPNTHTHTHVTNDN